MPRSTDAPVDRDPPHREAPGSQQALVTRLERLTPSHPSSPVHDTGADRVDTDVREMAAWEAALPQFEEAWRAHLDRWPRAASDTGQSELGTDAAIEQRLSGAMDKIKMAAEQITETMRSVEAEDPSRNLVALDSCLKGRDRLLGKVAQRLDEKPGRTPEAELDLIPDAVRYTFEYSSDKYVGGVRADLVRLLDAGFEPVKVKNYWADPEYKGINSQWRDPATGQRFEVQFHTAVSREAKEFTHGSYQRLRQPPGGTSREELLALHTFQREVARSVPMPARCLAIPDYP